MTRINSIAAAAILLPGIVLILGCRRLGYQGSLAGRVFQRSEGARLDFQTTLV